MIHALTFAAYAVTLDGKTVLPRARAMVAAGHVLLPVRSLGNALGADVGYDGRVHTITVQRGAHVATISSRGAVRIVNGSAYAPLRAVATAFGLTVAYEARSRTVALADRAPARPVAQDSGVPTPVVAEAPVRPARYTVTETPRDGAQVHEPYPAISVRFAGAAAIDSGSLRVLLDGNDVTRNAAVIGDQVLVTPRTALAPGSHTVAILARDTGNGAPLERTWTFGDSFAFAVGPPPAPYPISAIWIDRWIVPGTNAFDVYVEGAPGVTGYVGVDGVGGFFPLRVYSANAYVAHVFVPNGVNQPFARVAARLTLPDGRQEFIVLPQRVNLVTPPLTAAPQAATPVPGPSRAPIRRSVDVPTPTPAPRAPSAATPSPAPTPLRRSVLVATPSPPAAPVRAPQIIHTPSPPSAAPAAASPPAAAPSPSPSPPRTRRPLVRRPSPSPSP